MKPITVIITARNAEKTFAETLNSLVNQSLKQFQVLVINDASTDETAAIASSYGNLLDINIINLHENVGVAAARNIGVSMSQTPYISYLDADDIAYCDRLEVLHSFLEKNQSIDVVSSALAIFSDDSSHDDRILIKPSNDEKIKTSLLQFCSLSHGSSMLRRGFYDDVGLYDTKFDFAEDYEFWCRGALMNKSYANISKPLTRYRQHPNQVSKIKRELQHTRDMEIRRDYISKLINNNEAMYTPELFSLTTTFTSQSIGFEAIAKSIKPIVLLANTVPCYETYFEILNFSINKINSLQ